MNTQKTKPEEAEEKVEEESEPTTEDLKPQPRPKLAPRGIETFTVCRKYDARNWTVYSSLALPASKGRYRHL